ncbi:MAG: hypothetical protein AB7V77_04525 [Candidatus Woesearchaeota archaeon]
MKLTIKEKKENKALSRTEVLAEVVFEKATPNRLEIQDLIAKEAKSDKKLTIIKTIKTSFGKSSALVTAFIYSNADVMNSIERKSLIEKHKKAEEVKADKPEAE